MANDAGPNGTRIGLADAIASLRAELSRARVDAKGQDISFGVDKIEVELALEFGTTREAGGGLKLFSFLDLSGKAGDSAKTGHKVKLMLSVNSEGTPAQPFRISDAAGPGVVPRPAR